ncbi:unnamed protein product [Amoebophrya sp. A25]|nr:unnamed protein product [Amoebophrya sp. A25]|eukprot:GSA25T00010245001.1
MRAPLFLRTTVVGQLSSYLLLPLLLLLCTTKAHLVEGTIIKGWYQERDDHRAAAAGFLLGNGSALTVSGGTSGTSGGEGGHLRPLPAEQQADLEENKGRLILLQKQARDRKVREILRFLADPDTVAKIAELKFLEYVSTELLVGRENEDNDSSTRKDTKKPQPADVRSIAAFFQQFLEGVTAVEGTLAGFRPFGVLDEIKGERGDCSYPTTTQELSLELQYEKMREHYARVIETYLTESKVLNNESDRDGNNLIGKGNGGGSSAAERSPPSPQEAESRLDFAKRFRKVAQRAVVSKEKVKDIEKAANDYWKARKNYLGLLKEKEKDQQQRKEEEEGSTSKKEDGLPSITITSDSEMKQEEDLPSVTSEKMKHDEEDLPSVTGEKMKHDEEDPTRVTSEMKQEEDLPSVTSEKMKQDGEDPSPDTSEKKEEQDNNDGQRVFHLPWGVRVKDEDAEGGAAHSASSGDVQAMLEETEDLAKQVKRLQGEQKEQDQQDSAELLDPGVKNAEAEVKEAADRLRSVLGSSFGLNEILIGPKDHDVRHGNQFDMLLASFIREEAEEKQHRSEVEDVLGVGGNPKHFVRLGTEEKITGIPLGTKLSTSRHPAYSFYKKGDEINETTGGADAARSSKSTASCSSASSKRSLSALFVHACRAALKHDPDGNPSPACRDVLKHDPDGNPSPACRAALMSEDAGQEVVPRIARFQGSLEIGSKIRRTTSSTGEDTSLPTVAPSSRTPQDEHADDVDDLQELAPPLQEQKMADENECTGEQNENEYPGDSGSWRLISSLRDGPAIPPPPLYIVADTVKKDPVYFAFLAVAHKALKEAKLLRGPFTSNAYTPRNRATPANKTWTAAATSMAELLLSAFRGSSSWSTTTSSTTTSIMPAESHTRMTTTGASTTTSMTESDAIRSSFVVAVVIRKLLNMQVLSTVLDVAPIFLSKILEEAEKRLVAGAGGSRQGDDGTQTRRDGLQTHNLFLKSSTFTRATTMSHFLYELPEGVRKEAVKREIGEHGAVVDRSPEGYLKREDEDFTTNFWRISAIQEEMRDILRRSTRRLGKEPRSISISIGRTFLVVISR